MGCFVAQWPGTGRADAAVFGLSADYEALVFGVSKMDKPLKYGFYTAFCRCTRSELLQIGTQNATSVTTESQTMI